MNKKANSNIIVLFLLSIIPKSLSLIKYNDNNDKFLGEPKYISLIFNVNNPSNKNSNIDYSSYNFLNDFFLNNLSVELNVGTPLQKVDSFINPENICFQFIEKKKLKNQNKKINAYIPKESLTFLLNKNNKAIKAEDLFLFKNENINRAKSEIHLPFILDSEINEKTEFINEIGLNSKFSLDNAECPNFIKELKKNRIINEEIYSLIYTVEKRGKLFIGDYLHNIDKDRYKKNNFYCINTVKDKNTLKWSINFDKIYIYDKFLAGNESLSNKTNNGKVYLPDNTKVNIKIDQKLIIGTLEYKNMIDDLYFNNLIKSNICKIDLVKYNNKNYYVYSCTALLFATFVSPFPDEDDDFYYQEPVYHYIHFPSILFYSKNLNYYFELNYEKLFEIKGDRFYFMIVFECNSGSKNQEWVIGEHFIKNHIFSYDIKSQQLLFYNEKYPNDNFERNDENEKSLGNDTSKKNKNKNIVIFLLVLGVVCFSFLSFYLGIKIKERRKKKANELRDEYEYISESETKHNSINKEKYNITIEGKIFQEIELNSNFIYKNQK